MVGLITLRGKFDVNAYFCIDDTSAHGFLIDPGAQPEKVMAAVRRNGWTIEKILLTHGHFDHMGAADQLRQKLGAEIYAFDKTGAMLKNARNNLSLFCGPAITIDGALPLTDGEVISLEGAPSFCLKVMHTPGHTPDSVTFYSARENTAFVGDTIFKAGIGSWEYPGGSRADLINSITKRIFTLPDETVLCSGHSRQTTVGTEKRRYSL